MFKKFSFFLSCWLLIGNVAPISAQNENSLQFTVTKHEYALSTEFEMTSESEFIGNVVKSIFHVFTHYDVYDHLGVFEGQGIHELSFSGLFGAWGTDIEVTDATGNYLGYIDGEIATLQAAKFVFYDAADNCVGVAYLDENCSAFTIYDGKSKKKRVLARLTRNFVKNTVDYWDVTIYDTQALSPMLVRVFAAFACDSQAKFKKDR